MNGQQQSGAFDSLTGSAWLLSSSQVHPPKQLVVPLAVPQSSTPAPYKVASLQHSSFQDVSTQTIDDSSVGSS